MRFMLIAAGDYIFEDEPINKGLIGGKIIATNKTTKEVTSRVYKHFHNGKNNKYDVLTQLLYELAPPPKEEEENNGDTIEET